MVDSSDSGSFCESHCSLRHFQMVISSRHNGFATLMLVFNFTKKFKKEVLMTKTFQNCDIEIFEPPSTMRGYILFPN